MSSWSAGVRLAALLPALVAWMLITGSGEARADFSVQSAVATLTDSSGQPATQAGSHPDFTTSFSFGTTQTLFGPVPDGSVHEVRVTLPPGMVGNLTAVPQCSQATFDAGVSVNGNFRPCPPSTQVGTTKADTQGPGTPVFFQVPVYNMKPSPGAVSELGFTFAGMTFHVRVTVQANGQISATVLTPNVSVIFDSSLTLWGVPGDPSHDAERDYACNNPTSCVGGGVAGTGTTPYLTLPSDCSGPPPRVAMDFDSWEHIGDFIHIQRPVGPWTGCDRLAFAPTLTVTPDTTQAAVPSGYTFTLSVPQDDGSAGLATAPLRDAHILLPAGVTISPPSADGLQACSDAQLGLGSVEPPTCPPPSTLGSVALQTPLLPDQLSGEIYLRSPAAGNLFRVVLVVHGSGVLLKIPGLVEPDPLTGQLLTKFDYAPQLPFSSLTLHLDGGQRAALANPPTCGTATTTGELTAWGGVTAHTTSSFEVNADGLGAPCAALAPFNPTFIAGTQSPVAASTSSFVLSFARSDQDQELRGIAVDLPPGLLGNLSDVSLCPAAAASTGACPASSRIGSTVVQAGSGTSPLSLPQAPNPAQPVYLTEGHGGAPFGLSVVVRALAGPFDLGTVVVQAAVWVDPHTSALRVVSDPLPRILQGVLLRLRSVTVLVDRPGFMLNPTDCNPQSVTAAIESTEGATAPVSAPFGLTNCAALRFTPKLSSTVSTGAHAVKGEILAPKANGVALHVKLAFPAGSQGTQSNAAKVKVELPKQLPSRLSTLQRACTAAQFAAGPAGCPSGSVVGSAKVLTPVLPVPLTGLAYLVSHGGEEFPALTIVLHGYGVTIELVGKTFISKAGVTSTTFNTVPDVLFSVFELTLPQGRYSLLSGNGDLCRSKLLMPTEYVAQNGIHLHQSNPITIAGCPKKPTKKAKRAKRSRAATAHRTSH